MKDLKEVKNYHKNPRRISAAQIELLETELKKLGDLSGIVHDINSNEIIGGNQRTTIFKEKAKVVITDEFEKPDKQGTIAWGYVIWNKSRYTYRQVKWTAEQCEEANVVANKLGGDFDMVALVEDFNLDDLKKWGFEDFELEPFAPDVDEDLPDVDIQGTIEGKGDYLVIQFSEDELKYYEKIKDKFGVMANTRIMLFNKLIKATQWDLKTL